MTNLMTQLLHRDVAENVDRIGRRVSLGLRNCRHQAGWYILWHAMPVADPYAWIEVPDAVENFWRAAFGFSAFLPPPCQMRWELHRGTCQHLFGPMR